jgi:putative ABC transport system permease protein
MHTPLIKPLRDLWVNKLRTLLVALSIAVSVFGISAVLSASDLLNKTQQAAFSDASQADVTVSVDPLGEDVLGGLRALDGVRLVEGRLSFFARWRPEGDADAWEVLQVIGAENIAASQINKVSLKEGNYPSSGQIMPEQSSLDVFESAVGGRVVIESAGGERSFRVAGYGKSPLVPAAGVSGFSTVYMPLADAEALFFGEAGGEAGGDEPISGVNTVLIKVENFETMTPASREAIEDDIRAALEADGAYIQSLEVRDPTTFPNQDIAAFLFMLMGGAGALAFVLSGFLVINTMAAIIGEQRQQIGVMKANGASTLAVLRIYLTLALIYGLLGTVLGLVGGIVGGYILVRNVGTQMNVEVAGFSVAPQALGGGLLIGLLVTVGAALPPTLLGTRVTVREALGSHGVGADFGAGLIDRLVNAFGFLPRPVLIALRNTFRRKARLAMTLLALGVAGAAFIAVRSTNISLNRAVDRMLAAYQADVAVILKPAISADESRSIAQDSTQARLIEDWYNIQVTLDGRENVFLSGPPVDTTTYGKDLLSGRWFAPGDEGVIILAERLARDQGLSVGNSVEVTYQDETVEWQVIGVVRDRLFDGVLALAPREQVAGLAGREGQVNGLYVVARDPADLDALEDELQELYGVSGAQVLVVPLEQRQEQIRQQYGVLVLLLSVVVVLVGVVGGIGLFSTLSMNVVERRREIGIMRSLGAGSLTVLSIHWLEGLVIGGLGALLGAGLGVPGARQFVGLLSQQVLQMEFVLPLDIVLQTFGLALAIATFASLGPAMAAARLRVGETLRYE